MGVTKLNNRLVGPGMGPRVTAYSGWKGTRIAAFDAFDATMTAGVRVAAAYISDDDRADIVVATAQGAPNAVRVFDSNTGKPVTDVPAAYTPLAAGSTAGVFVTATNDPVQPLVNTPGGYRSNAGPGEMVTYDGIVTRDHDLSPTPTGTLSFAAMNYQTGVIYGLGVGTLAGIGDGQARATVRSAALTDPGMYALWYEYGGDDHYDWAISNLGAEVITKFGNKVWDDANYNGLQDPDELGIGGVTVQVVRPDNSVIAETKTDGGGFYWFGGVGDLPGGTPQLRVHVVNPDPDRYGFTRQPDKGWYPGMYEESDSNVIDQDGYTKEFQAPPYGGSYVNGTWDAGLVQYAKVGDYVWYDDDEDGLQDAEEEGLAGVTVEALRIESTPYSQTESSVRSTVSDSDGKYLLDKLFPGDYKLHFHNPDPDRLVYTQKDAPDGTNAYDATDSDADELTGKTAVFALLEADDERGKDGATKEIKIKSVTWEQKEGNTGGLLDSQPAGTPGGGKRIYAEKKTYNADTVSDKVDLRVTLNTKKAGVVIKLYMYDVDDPSANERVPVNTATEYRPDEKILDDESKATDNRGVQAGTIGAFVGTTDANGEIRITRTVTRQPGDNFRVAATIETADLVTTVEARQKDNGKGSLYFIGMNELPDTMEKTVKSPLLTVWRHLHLERDRMKAPGANEVFDGAGVEATDVGKDDVNPNGPIPDPPIDYLQTIIRAAYIEAVDDLGTLNTNREWDFIHNMGYQDFESGGSAAGAGLSGKRDVHSSDGFWTVQILGAYEFYKSADGDHPIGGKTSWTSGISHKYKADDRQENPAAIFTETVRDLRAAANAIPGLYGGQPPVAESTYLKRMVAHEVGHRLQAEHSDYMIMEDATATGFYLCLAWGDPVNAYSPSSLERIRSLDRPT